MDFTRKAVALAYEGDIPRILARGKGKLAEKLLEIARDNSITLYKDRDLAEVLYILETGSEIPEDLYAAVAVVLAYCYRVNDEFRERMKNIKGFNEKDSR